MGTKFDDIELIEAFTSECRYLTDDVEPIFIELKNGTGDANQKTSLDSINRIFRVFHSIKGSAGFLQFNNIAGVTHQTETLLDIIRFKNIKIKACYLDVLLKSLDAIREMLGQVEATRNDKGMELLREETEEALVDAINLANGKDDKGKEQDFPQKTEEIQIEFHESAVNGSTVEIPEFTITSEMAVRFSQESAEIIDNTEECMLKLTKAAEQDKAELIARAFRNIHSFKGNCGFMQLSDLEKVSHAVENLLDSIRNGDTKPSAGNIDILMQAIDSLRVGLLSFANGGNSKIDNCELMVEFLADIMKSSENKNRVKPELPEKEPDDLTEVKKLPDWRASFEDAGKTDISQKQQEIAGIENQKQVRRDIRVDVGKLDSLIDLVGELIIAESVVLGNPLITGLEDETLERSIHHLQRVSSDLQDIAMSVRMIPLSATFKKMIRLVHDLSRKSAKKVNLELVGEDTEVDKNVIEEISDPIVHIIRNAVDHGIESPEARILAGKSEIGTVTIDAKHEGGEVWISIKDDGGGMNREKIIAKAIEKNLIKGDGSDLRDEDVYKLTFEPGFSTADKITDISGRGVGMDVVKKNIENLNGRISVKSFPGEGSTIILHIPLTLAIIDGMLVKVGSNQYTIPLLSIRESIRAADNIITHTPDGQELVRVRDEIIPVLRMHKIYNKKTDVTKISEGILVLVEADSEKAALFVDGILGQQEIVIKGLSSYLGDLHGISGCTILGNGQVSLIIDVGGLLKSVDCLQKGMAR